MAIVTAISAIAASVAAAATAIGGVATGVAGATLGGALTATAVAASQIGMVVGVVGLGMSVIGMATGNKTLSKIGGYLGMAGGVLSVGGALAGGMPGAMKGFSQAWDDGVGSLFSSTKPVGQEALSAGALQEKLGRSIVDNSLAQQAAQAKAVAPVSSSSVAPSATLGPRPQLLPPPSASAGASTGGVNPLDFAGAAKTGAVRPDMAATQFANAAPGSAPSATGPLAAVTSQASASPLAGSAVPTAQAGSQLATHHLAPDSLSNLGESGKSFWDSLPDWAKAQVAMNGTQFLSGMAGGWFESATAEERLALDREAQQWRMQHEDSIKNFTQRNASYAPTVTFGGGMLSKGKA